MARRLGRGRLSSIEELPEEADEAVNWALDALRDRSQPQTQILARFNEMLAELDLDPPVQPISRSAFGRFTIRFSAQAARLKEAQEMAAAMAARWDDMPEGDVGLMVGETIMALVNDVLLDGMLTGETLSLKMLREAAETIERVAKARRAGQMTHIANRNQLLAKAAEKVDEAVGELTETRRAELGLTTKTIEQIKAEILGIRETA
ncbi:MAG: phage protein Gp27 family protein [Pseudomonadota bacterium]